MVSLKIIFQTTPTPPFKGGDSSPLKGEVGRGYAILNLILKLFVRLQYSHHC